MIDKISGGWFDFDVVVATPNMMGAIGKIARVLGPKGLMPNPKTGTVNPDIAKAVKEIKAGKVQYRADKEANVHVSIARVSFETSKIEENLHALVDALLKARPAAVKGTYKRQGRQSSSRSFISTSGKQHRENIKHIYKARGE